MYDYGHAHTMERKQKSGGSLEESALSFHLCMGSSSFCSLCASQGWKHTSITIRDLPGLKFKTSRSLQAVAEDKRLLFLGICFAEQVEWYFSSNGKKVYWGRLLSQLSEKHVLSQLLAIHSNCFFPVWGHCAIINIFSHTRMINYFFKKKFWLN